MLKEKHEHFALITIVVLYSIIIPPKIEAPKTIIMFKATEETPALGLSVLPESDPLPVLLPPLEEPPLVEDPAVPPADSILVEQVLLRVEASTIWA